MLPPRLTPSVAPSERTVYSSAVAFGIATESTDEMSATAVSVPEAETH
jgi:hypothetical protein